MTTQEPSAPATLTASSGHALLAKQWAQLAHREGFGSDRTVIDMIIGHVDELDAQLRAALKPSPSPVVVEPTAQKALADLCSLIDEGWLVRNTAEDSEPNWAMRQVRAVHKLGNAYAALNPKRPEEGKST